MTNFQFKGLILSQILKRPALLQLIYYFRLRFCAQVKSKSAFSHKFPNVILHYIFFNI